MAVEVGRHARQVVGEIVLEIRYHSISSGLKRGTSLSVPLMYCSYVPSVVPPISIGQRMRTNLGLWTAPWLSDVALLDRAEVVRRLFLGLMLGVRRSGVTIAIKTLSASGLIV